MLKKYKGPLNYNDSGHVVTKNEPEKETVSMEMLIRIQAEALRAEYKTECLNVKQLQKVLNIGESSAYKFLNSGSVAVKSLDGRKVVPVIPLAAYLVQRDS